MAFNDSGPFSKRIRTDEETMDKGGPFGYNNYDSQPRRRKEPENPNHVILLTVLNPVYPITVDVVHTITQPYGNVLRIVIFKKNGVQAMVEFDSVDSATRAKEQLQGADIYSGCCTLRIEYAKPTKLNVFKNDSESWDFTNMGMPEPKDERSPRPPLLQEPRFGGGMSSHMGGSRNSGLFNPMSDRFGVNDGMANGMRGGSGGGHFLGGGGGPHSSSMGSMGQPGPGLQQGAVLMVYGLNKDVMNPDKLFNLLCLYGNIVRIKFLKTKEGCAMVQMGDALAVERAIGNLNNVSFFGSKMQLGYSKQAFLADVQQPFDLPDGSPSFCDFIGNKNNRFMNPEMASKNRIQPASKILHFFNAPPGLTEDTINEICKEAEIEAPKNFRLFPSKTERSSSGLLEFHSLSEAIEALCCINHVQIPNETSKYPYVMKLCFSSTRNIPSGRSPSED